MRPDVTQTVIAAVKQIAVRQTPPPEITLDQSLVRDLALDSLDIAELVATLEAELACDPFAADAAIADARTVGDLVAIYQRHLEGRR